MRFWLTTHWPRREDEEFGTETGVWLPDGRHAPGARIAERDMLLVYETKSGRSIVSPVPSADRRRIRRKPGKEGIITVARITDRLRAVRGTKPERYTDGTTVWWRWHAPAEVLSEMGFVDRRSVARVLGYKPSYNFRGFGEEHSGLLELTQEQFEELQRRFTLKHTTVLKPDPIPRGGVDAGGESEAHRALKEYVGENPERALGEAGLRTLYMEFPFITGDRADLVLEDRFGRIVAVEVKVDTPDGHEAGPLQAIKYRGMLEWKIRRKPGESRAFLVAHSIARSVRARCKVYGIECFAVPVLRLRQGHG